MAEHLYAMVPFCPHCGRRAESFRLLCERGGPAPGKAALCNQCGTWSVWDDDMDLRPPTIEELDVLDNDNEAREILRGWAVDWVRRHLPPKRMQ